MTEKMAVFAAMPRARAATAMTVKPGLFDRMRKARRRSLTSFSIPYTVCFIFLANLWRNFCTFGATTYEQYGCVGLLAKYS